LYSTSIVEKKLKKYCYEQSYDFIDLIDKGITEHSEAINHYFLTSSGIPFILTYNFKDGSYTFID